MRPEPQVRNQDQLARHDTRLLSAKIARVTRPNGAGAQVNVHAFGGPQPMDDAQL